MSAPIDVTFDFRSDTLAGKDPDVFSPTLRRYHKALWSKALPGGQSFSLDDSDPRFYLIHSSGLGEFILSSDSVIPTYTLWKRMQHIIRQFPESENEGFRALGYTIGGMMMWPAIPKNGLRTINVERGFNAKIADRMDLTLECIRRHYLGQASPMARVLAANAEYFALFRDFQGFVDFFLLQDLVSADYGAVRFFMSFDGFRSSPRPRSIDAYRTYREATVRFVNARNARIAGLKLSV